MREIIKQIQFIDGLRRDIVIEDGMITHITVNYTGEGKLITVPDDVYVSAGWIDIHTHAFPKFKPYCAKPDDIGYLTGVTTVVDAGSCGYDDIDEFHRLKQGCLTRVYAFINVSRIGLRVRDELKDLSLIDCEGIQNAIERYSDMIVGIKARMSASVIGDNGITPLAMAKEIGQKVNLPLMVHVGSAPPDLDEILDLLMEGDIVTHCFHEKENNHIFTGDERTERAVKEAINRGVYFDIGHGTSSFSFMIAKKALRNRVPFHSISTDIYEKNQHHGPVFDLATTMSKFLSLGYSLETIIRAVTENPAKMIGKEHIGSLAIGKAADLTFFKLENKETVLQDSFGKEITAKKIITPYAVMIGGEYLECSTNEIAKSN